MEMLQTLNMIGFRKALKKFEKIVKVWVQSEFIDASMLNPAV